MKNKIALILGSTALAITSTVLMVSAQSASAGEVYSLENIATGRCLDSDPGGKAYTLGCNNGAYQRWDVSQSGSGYILRNDKTGRCLDSNDKGDAYTLDCNGGPYQLWNYTSTSHHPPYGKYWNVATGRCLDSDNSGNAYTYPCKDESGGQNWFSRRR
jgi:Ricin-type beta-trefoil lectin domain